MTPTQQLINKTRARLAELDAEIPAAREAWKAALLGEGDADELSAQTTKLLTEQVVEIARLEALEEKNVKECVKKEDEAQLASVESANKILRTHAEWAQQLKDKMTELLAFMATAPKNDTIYALAVASGKHIARIDTDSIPSLHPVSEDLRDQLSKVFITVLAPKNQVAAVRSDRFLKSATAAQKADQIRAL